jgi:hypothetical protein
MIKINKFNLLKLLNKFGALYHFIEFYKNLKKVFNGVINES